MYRWLPIVFGCHCRDDRSFHYHGRRFPICARCTGELAGILVSLAASFFRLPPVWLAVCLMAPMVIDGFVQLCTAYESTNPRRFVTGFLFGYSLLALLWLSTGAAFRWGRGIGLALAGTG